MRQPVAAVVAEAAVQASAAAEQAVQCAGAQPEQLLAHVVGDREGRRLGVNGLLEPRRRLPGRRGERDERLAWRLLREQRHDPRDGGGLAGARAAGHDRQAPQHGGGRREPLPVVVLAGEQPPEPIRELVEPDLRRLGAGERLQVGRDPPLLAPVAVEVERAADEPQRPVGGVLADGDEPAGGHPLHPLDGRRPRQRGEIDPETLLGVVGVDRGGGVDRAQVDEHVSDPRRADGEGGSEDYLLVGLAAERREPERDVDVGGRQHARVVERPQQTGRVQGAAGVERVGERAHWATSRCSRSELARESAPADFPPSNASLRAVTSAASGCQPQTPHGVPSTTGVSAPVIPRRKR